MRSDVGDQTPEIPPPIFPRKQDLRTEFFGLLSLLGSILTPLDFSSMAFFTGRHRRKP